MRLKSFRTGRRLGRPWTATAAAGEEGAPSGPSVLVYFSTRLLVDEATQFFISPLRPPLCLIK